MGCKLTKDVEDPMDNDMSTNPDPAKPQNGHTAAAIKAKVEKKMCLARETPEPIFDLSDCHLKELPSIFVLCKVLRKEQLLLHQNQLSSLRGGGQLGDLSLLRILDLRENKIKSLPEEVSELIELRELFLSHNLIDRLPNSLYRLHKLEILDAAHNKLTSVAEIKQLANLRVLLLNGNASLRTLSAALATCDSLYDVVVDSDTIEEPPARVCDQGTKAILNYLMGALNADEIDTQTTTEVAEDVMATKLFIDHERHRIEEQLDASRNRLELRTNQLLAAERVALEKDHHLEAAMRHQQDARRQNLLKEIKAQQELQESQINELHSQKTQNRDNLIRNIIEEEERWRGLVAQSIEVKSFTVDPLLLEQEADEQNRLLDKLKVQQEDLRKQEVLQAMQNLLEDELSQVETYQRQKAVSSNRVLTKETEKMNLLADVFDSYNQNKNQIVEQIISDEVVQKSAVAQLIAKNDSRSWALVEQMRIIESHLAAISAFEMEKRRDGSSQQLIDLAERRVVLSQVLMELMAQQDLRKKELIDILTKMENERDDRKDFWLLQYQRLLDSQPENVDFDSSIDPELGYNFLANGVVHCLPFLSRLWQDKSKTWAELDDEDLREAGIRKESDRCGILKSIAQFLAYRTEKTNGGMGIGQSQSDGTTTEVLPAEAAAEKVADESRQVDQEEELAECVICMDNKVKIIFLLCGHLACCEDCHESVEICPICRAPIQQRIRVIQA